VSLSRVILLFHTRSGDYLLLTHPAKDRLELQGHRQHNMLSGNQQATGGIELPALPLPSHRPSHIRKPPFGKPARGLYVSLRNTYSKLLVQTFEADAV